MLRARAYAAGSLWGLLAGLWCSCYNPDLTAGFACRSTSECPEGRSCVDGRCAAPGVEAQPDLTTPAPDPEDLSAPPPPPDMTSPRPTDMASPSADMTQPPKKACAGNVVGYQVGAKGKEEDVLACVANFAAGKAGDQCPNNYRLCSDRNNPDMDKLKAMNIAACESVGGFFTADVLAAFRASNGNLVCQAASIPSPFALPGCGKEDQVTAVTTSECLMFKAGFPCDKQSTWSCGQVYRLSSASHNNNANQGGVLCCKG